MTQLAVLTTVALTLAWIARVAVAWSRRTEALLRLEADAAPTGGALADPTPETAFTEWLGRAGFRDPNAPVLFVVATVGGALLGLLAGQLYRVSAQAALVNQIAVLPGSSGEILAQLLSAGPWILFVLMALLPFSIVRTRRRARVRAIEQDMPLALEMLATMAEAGLGFDAALSNIVKTRGPERPLASEFVRFQLELVGGMTRAQALRQLGRRVHVPSMTSFTSSLIQAEQVGASIADTLQHQASDLRQRRREEALLRAQALPVKLVFPLVLCFLPGVFLSTLAPVLYQMIEVANSVLRGGQ